MSATLPSAGALHLLASAVGLTFLTPDQLAVAVEELPLVTRDLIERACQDYIGQCVRVRAVEAQLAGTSPLAVLLDEYLAPPTERPSDAH